MRPLALPPTARLGAVLCVSSHSTRCGLTVRRPGASATACAHLLAVQREDQAKAYFTKKSAELASRLAQMHASPAASALQVSRRSCSRWGSFALCRMRTSSMLCGLHTSATVPLPQCSTTNLRTRPSAKESRGNHLARNVVQWTPPETAAAKGALSFSRKRFFGL
jgi:hypothetical protein